MWVKFEDEHYSEFFYQCNFLEWFSKNFLYSMYPWKGTDFCGNKFSRSKVSHLKFHFVGTNLHGFGSLLDLFYFPRCFWKSYIAASKISRFYQKFATISSLKVFSILVFNVLFSLFLSFRHWTHYWIRCLIEETTKHGSEFHRLVYPTHVNHGCSFIRIVYSFIGIVDLDLFDICAFNNFFFNFREQ